MRSFDRQRPYIIYILSLKGKQFFLNSEIKSLIEKKRKLQNAYLFWKLLFFFFFNRRHVLSKTFSKTYCNFPGVITNVVF